MYSFLTVLGPFEAFICLEPVPSSLAECASTQYRTRAKTGLAARTEVMHAAAKSYWHTM